jgi:outer membrane protein TolC
MVKHLTRIKFAKILKTIILLSISDYLIAQNLQDTLTNHATLSVCIRYALQNQPIVKQSILEEDISDQDVKIALSDWLPQINSNANIQHFFKLPESYFPNTSDPTGPEIPFAVGVANTSAFSVTGSQILYNSDVFLASRTAKYYRKKASQSTQISKIDVVVNVSKAFYDVLLTQQQLNLIVDDIQRLDRNLKDAFNQYQSGISDKIDYKRATIALNSAMAEKKNTEESIKTKYEFLKQLMGYPPEQKLLAVYDSSSMAKDVQMDTSQFLVYNNRIEYQLLQTQLMLQKAMVDYYKFGFFPSLSGFFNYTVVYQDPNFQDLYKRSFPNYSIGATLTFPLFEGLKKVHQTKRAKLQYEQLALDTMILKNQFSTEFIQANASYKSNLIALHLAKENVSMAKEVFDLVKLQYNRGIKAYLEVIVSESDLRTAEINELYALFRVLSGKLDVQKALGNISINF